MHISNERRREASDRFYGALQRLRPPGSRWDLAFAEAVNRCPTIRLRVDPKDLLQAPDKISVDLRISLCVVFGSVDPALVFPGRYDPGKHGMIALRIFEGAVNNHDKFRYDSFLTWLRDSLLIRGHEVGYDDIRSWADYAELPHIGLSDSIAEILGLSKPDFISSLHDLGAPAAPKGYAKRAWRAQARIDTYFKPRRSGK